MQTWFCFQQDQFKLMGRKRERENKMHICNATTLVILSYIFYQKVSLDPNTENMCESPHRLQAKTVDTPPQ